MVESEYCMDVELTDAAGTLSYDFDCTLIEVLQSAALSSTTGSHSATNLTLNTDYTLWWFVFEELEFINNYSVSNDVDAALAASIVDEATVNFTSTATSERLVHQLDRDHNHERSRTGWYSVRANFSFGFR